MSSKDTQIYKVIFLNQSKVYEVYASSISQGGLFGFIEIEELIFNARSGLVVDPSEEKIRTEFKGVNRTYIPMHSIIRIDEVEKQGVSKITKADGGNISQFPSSMYVPPDHGDKGGSSTN
ncbi:MAG: DUF1820 family protein [Gammaproteobacteria bacterium]|jgi:hypothetical protein|nr:DUF1820 family protein [Pseudomonadota bacterium]